MIATALTGVLLVGTAHAWTKSVSSNPVDDTKTVVIIQEAEGTYINRYGRPGRANLQILCEQNKTGLALVLPELYTSDTGGLGRVTFRIDDKPAFERDMIAANDRGSMIALSGQAISAVKEMIGGSRLLVRFITVSEPSIDVYFDLADLDGKITDVRTECGW
jgi:type VI secretion system protein VasI